MSYSITLTTSSIKYVLDPAASNTPLLIPKDDVVKVLIQTGTHILNIKCNDDITLNVDLTTLSNQSTWSTGDLTGDNNALTAFDTWLAVSGGGGGGGDASAANQVTGNNSLASIDGKTPSVGQKIMSGSAPVTIASDQSTLPVSAASLPLPSNAAQETGGNLATIVANTNKIPFLGQAIMVNSAPVTIASNQTTLPVAIQGVTGNALVRPDQELRVAIDASSVFYDSFESFDTTNRWTSGGTVPPTAGTGTLTVSAGTTSLSTSILISQPTFPLLGNMFNECLSLIQTDSTLKTGAYRFFGLGTAAGSPTVSAPITNGVGFEWIDTTGILSGVVWSGGVKTGIVSLSVAQPLDSNIHRFQVYFKSSRVYFEIDNVSQGSIAYPNPQVTTLPLLSLVVNGASTVSPAAVFTSSFIGLGDTASNNQTISDGTFPWRKVAVSATGALSVSSPGIPTALGQQSAATSQPVTLSNEDVQDLYFIGQSAQTALVNNIIPVAVSANATDLTGYRSGYIQIVCPAGTYTTGAIIFEGANDSASGTIFQTIPVTNQLTGATTSGAITLVTTTNIGYTFPVNFRYVRVRISTAVSGASASVQAISKFSQTPWNSNFLTVIQPTAANLNVTATGTLTAVTTVTTLANGQTAHSSPATGSPLRVAGRVYPATPDLTLVAGDASDVGITTAQQLLIKPFSPSELDFTFAGSISASTTAAVFKNAAGASIRNFVTGITLNSDTLTTATEVVIKDTAITFSSQTIASNIITSAAVHDLKIGDQFVASASTVTGLTAGTVYYVLTVPSTTTLTLSATPNGTTLVISGTGVTATANRILFRTKLQTTSFGPTQFTFNTPLRGTPNGTLDIQTVTSTVAGVVYYNIQGYIGF